MAEQIDFKKTIRLCEDKSEIKRILNKIKKIPNIFFIWKQILHTKKNCDAKDEGRIRRFYSLTQIQLFLVVRSVLRSITLMIFSPKSYLYTRIPALCPPVCDWCRRVNDLVFICVQIEVMRFWNDGNLFEAYSLTPKSSSHHR